MAGQSYATWGDSPVRAFSGSSDGFVAKLNTDGALQWNTFLGSPSFEYSHGIALGGGGNIYVTGSSAASWGAPVRPYSGLSDTFVAKLSASGSLEWNTFLGSADWERPGGIAAESAGGVFVTGESSATWGSPTREFSGYVEAYVAKLNTAGVLQWNAFLGSGGDDRGRAVVITGSGGVFVVGDSELPGGTPRSARTPA